MMNQNDERGFTLTGLTIRIRLHSMDSNGTLGIIEERLPPGTGSPLHTIRADSTLYILDGTVTITRGDTTIPASAGDLVFIPHGVPHRVANMTTDDARLLVIVVPGGYEQFLQELHRAGSKLTEDPHLIDTISARYGIELC
jgi:quercetin dioxygenase-like cupin family protein